MDYVTQCKGDIINSTMKCRGIENFPITYDPEYDALDNIERLRQLNLKRKRELALKEFTLGLESLTRFVKREPLNRMHECVFGVVAFESETLDPKLQYLQKF